MGQLAIIGFSALAGAGVLGFMAETNTLTGILMGAVLGGTTAIAMCAFPTDLDYRERRVWPPREP
jgi:hypothetical protein